MSQKATTRYFQLQQTFKVLTNSACVDLNSDCNVAPELIYFKHSFLLQLKREDAYNVCLQIMLFHLRKGLSP